MEPLPLATCAQMLGIHPKTLHHWLKEAHVPFASHPSDARIKCVEPHHLLEVAGFHSRSLPELSASPEEQARLLPPHEAEPERLSSSGSDLIQKVFCLEAKVVGLQEQVAHLALALLAEQERTLASRLTVLETSMMAHRPSQPVVAPSLPQGQIAVPTLSPAAAPPPPRTRNPAENHIRPLLPLIEYGADGAYVIMCPHEGELPLTPDSAEWFAWLACLSSFRFVGQSGRFTAYRVSKRHIPTRSWRAVRSLHNHNYKHHLGVTDHLTMARLEQAAATLQAYMTSL